MSGINQQSSEIYLEFQAVGQTQKVTAIDAATGIEVVVLGPLNATREHMTQIAVKKLKRRIQQEIG